MSQNHTPKSYGEEDNDKSTEEQADYDEQADVFLNKGIEKLPSPIFVDDKEQQSAQSSNRAEVGVI